MFRHQQGRRDARDEVRTPSLPPIEQLFHGSRALSPLVPDPSSNPDAPSPTLTPTPSAPLPSYQPGIDHDQILAFYKPDGPPKLLFTTRFPR